MSIRRARREEMTSSWACRVQGLLEDLFPPRRGAWCCPRRSSIITATAAAALALEAGVVRLADALDMAQGRSRVPFEAGQVDIPSVSAAAIDACTSSTGRRSRCVS